MIKSFEYFAPKKIEEVLALLSQYREESKVIAGGQSLLPLMKRGLVAPKYLIDIKGLSLLDYINFDVKEGLSIGSLTSHRTIETSPVIRNGFGVIADVMKKLSSIEIRNWGTIGGNLCEGNPANDPPLALIVLKGKLKIASLSGERTMLVEDFFESYGRPALQADELLTEVQVSNPLPHMGAAFDKFTIIERDMAIASTAVSITLGLKNKSCSDARIALGAVAPIPMRAKRAEKVLVGKRITDNLLEEAGQVAAEEVNPISDLRASEEYRRELIKILVKRVAREASEIAQRV